MGDLGVAHRHHCPLTSEDQSLQNTMMKRTGTSVLILTYRAVSELLLSAFAVFDSSYDFKNDVDHARNMKYKKNYVLLISCVDENE